MDLLIIEDKPRMAKQYYTSLDISELLGSVAFVTNLEQAEDFILDEPPPNIFWVDINLSSNEYEGIEILKHIKNRCPSSLVIVYTAYDVKNQCYSVGLKNLHYFEKDTTNMEDDFIEIKRLITDFIHISSTSVSAKIISYYAQIAHIEEKVIDGWVKLECYFQNQIIERIFHIDPIKAALNESLIVDNWVKIVVIEDGAEIKIVFEKTDELFYPEVQESSYKIISDDELMNSRIWSIK